MYACDTAHLEKGKARPKGGEDDGLQNVLPGCEAVSFESVFVAGSVKSATGYLRSGPFFHEVLRKDQLTCSIKEYMLLLP